MGFDGASIEHLIITNNLIERMMKENLKLYSWDDKTPNKHYEHIKNIKKGDFNYGKDKSNKNNDFGSN